MFVTSGGRCFAGGDVGDIGAGEDRGITHLAVMRFSIHPVTDYCGPFVSFPPCCLSPGRSLPVGITVSYFVCSLSGLSVYSGGRDTIRSSIPETIYRVVWEN